MSEEAIDRLSAAVLAVALLSVEDTAVQSLQSEGGPEEYVFGRYQAALSYVRETGGGR